MTRNLSKEELFKNGVKPDRRPVYLTIKITQEMRKKLQVLAHQEHRSMSQMSYLILLERLG